MLQKILNSFALIIIILSNKLINNIRRFRKVNFDYASKKYKFYDKDYFFILFGKDKYVSRNTFVNGPHDNELLKKSIQILNKKIYYLIDVGANIGTFCIPNVKHGRIKKCIAIEPVKEINKILNINIFLNNLENKIKIFDYVVSNESSQKLSLTKNKLNYGDNKFKISNFKNKNYTSVKLDYFLKYFNLHQLIIKIDVQGFEDRVLMGSKKFLQNKVPILIEFNFNFKRSKYFLEIMTLIEQKYTYFNDLNCASKGPEKIKFLRNKLNNQKKNYKDFDCLIF
jgi:FkbM family methyltransferase